MSIALFRVMGSLGRNMIVSNTFGSFAMLVVMALGGYIISRGTQLKPNKIVILPSHTRFMIFMFYSDRGYTKLVDLGFLGFPFDVCSKCSFCK